MSGENTNILTSDILVSGRYKLLRTSQVKPLYVNLSYSVCFQVKSNLLSNKGRKSLLSVTKTHNSNKPDDAMIIVNCDILTVITSNPLRH